MPYETLQAQGPRALGELLNGVVRGGEIQYEVDPDETEHIRGLNGLTLVFTAPAVTVTFTDPDPVDLATALARINTAVQAVDAAFVATIELASDRAPGIARRPRKRFVFQTDTAAGINITGGTARVALGFPTDRAGAPIVPSRIVAGGDSLSGGVYIILSP